MTHRPAETRLPPEPGPYVAAYVVIAAVINLAILVRFGLWLWS